MARSSVGFEHQATSSLEDRTRSTTLRAATSRPQPFRATRHGTWRVRGCPVAGDRQLGGIPNPTPGLRPNPRNRRRGPKAPPRWFPTCRARSVDDDRAAVPAPGDLRGVPVVEPKRAAGVAPSGPRLEPRRTRSRLAVRACGGGEEATHAVADLQVEVPAGFRAESVDPLPSRRRATDPDPA